MLLGVVERGEVSQRTFGMEELGIECRNGCGRGAIHISIVTSIINVLRVT
jgi:hypothetical protein